MTEPSAANDNGAPNTNTGDANNNIMDNSRDLLDATVPLSSTISAPTIGSSAPAPEPGTLRPAPTPRQPGDTTRIATGGGGPSSIQDFDGPQSEKPAAAGGIRAFPRTFAQALWTIITSSWINLLLVFVPVGIAVAQVESLHGPVAFSMNAVAIIPLAGLLSFATETVAAQLGDAVGALMNVTFGNAVELIIFIIALTKGKTDIVQASLLGSILSNLLLILGMCFLFGGLRYREQIYNSTVTQMSACLLSLSVISLVLPTAFHASFKEEAKAEEDTLKVSRGTSVILLLVYILYLLFQLKSHAYMYESTPQHIVDAESTPGPAAGWLDSSSSSSDDSSSSSSDSDTSRDTVRKKVKKVLRAGRRRKDSTSSNETNGGSVLPVRTTSGPNQIGNPELRSEASSSGGIARISSAPTNQDPDDSDDERETFSSRRKYRRKYRKHQKKRKARKERAKLANAQAAETGAEVEAGTPRRVDFAEPPSETSQEASRRSFPALRAISVKNLAPAVFINNEPPVAPAGPVPTIRYGIRRTNSLPDRLINVANNQAIRPPGALFPARIPAAAIHSNEDAPAEHHQHLSRPMAILLLLLSTALVAVCAEFMVDSIEAVTTGTQVPEVFIGLIVLPVVGNAAEHVTAITVAMKNKMDLAIGVAIGSSIQIALLITPFIVILGWIIDQPMTLYFTLFETVCLFVSAFIVNFLVLDGRSNYLEGALLCATYVIIAVVTFFSPSGSDASGLGE